LTLQSVFSDQIGKVIQNFMLYAMRATKIRFSSILQR